MKHFKSTLFAFCVLVILLFASFCVFGFLALDNTNIKSSVAHAQTLAPGCSDPNKKECLEETYHNQIDGGLKFPKNTFKSYGQHIFEVGSGIILGLAVLKIIFGGVMYATAAGNVQKIEEAKSHIYYALLGIALLVGMNVILLLIGAETY